MVQAAMNNESVILIDMNTRADLDLSHLVSRHQSSTSVHRSH
jgi:hypothetical protein